MRRIALCLTALLVTTFAPAVRAEVAPLPLPTGCRAAAVPVAALGADTYRGIVYSTPVVAAAFPMPAGDVLANPVSITLTCTLHVYSDTYPDPAISASASGTGLATVLPTAVTYHASSTAFDFVGVCGEARLVDANGATYTYYQSDDNQMWYRYSTGCDGLTCGALGGRCEYAFALISWVLDRAPFPLLDETVCSQLAALAPGVPGVVDIDPTGDTYVEGEFIWDCTPYETTPGDA
jgi:hypothetical protein